MAALTCDLLLTEFNEGDRIEAAPHPDCWMRGDRFGRVESIGWVYLRVRMDRSGKVRKFSPENAERI